MALDITSLINTVMTLFIIVVISCIATKCKLIDEVFTKGFSTFIICVAQPFMIMSALSEVEFSLENLKNGFIVTGIGFIVMAVCAAVALVSTLKFTSLDEKKICRFGIIFSNSGFMGIPVMKATFGEIGAFYGAFFVITFHIVLWTYGMYVLSKGRTDIKVKPLNMLVNYGTIPVIIGIILYLLPFDMPVAVKQAMSMLSSICAPGSMIIVGSIIASMPLKKLFLDKKVYYICAVKLILCPALICVLCTVCGLKSELVYLFTLITALPTATSCAMYAQKYDIKPDLAAKISSLTTVFSMATIPLMMYFASLIVSLRG